MESKPFVNYQKHRWFYTSSGKLVIGGRSATQNDELLKSLRKIKINRLVMHTATPGSPFSVILHDKKDLIDEDIEETAIFTGCFSREWRSNKKTANIDIFNLNQLRKPRKYPAGKWKVVGKIESKKVKLELVLTKQREKLRAVPPQTVKKKSKVFLKIMPGKIDKIDMLPKLQVESKEHFNQEELISALPAGGVSVSHK